MLLFIKVCYYIRKKVQGMIHMYFEYELKMLYKNRVSIHEGFYYTYFPVFNIDDSRSSIVIKDNVGLRGLVTFTINQGGKIVIGHSTFINAGSSLNSLDSIVIGDNCLIGEHVKIYDHNHQYQKSRLLIKNQGYTKAKVQIGNNCWIGSNVIILKGVSIGDNCVVGANCLISTSVPANSLVRQDCSSQIVSSIPWNDK